MTESNINGIFPTPVYISKLNRNLTKPELTFIDKIKLDCHNNEGNIVSNDNYILNQKIFKNLKKDLDLKIQDYFDKIICKSEIGRVNNNSIVPDFFSSEKLRIVMAGIKNK